MIPRMAPFSRIRLTRALINLINNAWSAVDQEKGHIRILVEEEEGRIRFRVEDDGIGIPKEDLEKVWDLGYSGRGSTGLGLAFTRQVVENHGGSVSITSENRQGTVAVIELPEDTGGMSASEE